MRIVKVSYAGFRQSNHALAIFIKNRCVAVTISAGGHKLKKSLNTLAGYLAYTSAGYSHSEGGDSFATAGGKEEAGTNDQQSSHGRATLGRIGTRCFK